MRTLLRHITVTGTSIGAIIVAALASGCQGQSSQPSGYAPGLGEIMTATQMRHAKLWFAGKAGNWQLADYEIYELQEGLDDAVSLHPDRTGLLSDMMAAPMKDMSAAVVAKDNARFIQAFSGLTNACNSCHQATEFGFNVVIIPTTNVYTNQDFEVYPKTE